MCSKFVQRINKNNFMLAGQRCTSEGIYKKQIVLTMGDKTLFNTHYYCSFYNALLNHLVNPVKLEFYRST